MIYGNLLRAFLKEMEALFQHFGCNTKAIYPLLYIGKFWFSSTRKNVNPRCLILKGALFRVLFSRPALIAVDKMCFQDYRVISISAGLPLCLVEKLTLFL